MSGKGKPTPSSLATRLSRLEERFDKGFPIMVDYRNHVAEVERNLLNLGEDFRSARDVIDAQHEKIGHIQRAVDGLQQRTGIDYAGIALDFDPTSNLNERLHWVEAQVRGHLDGDLVGVTPLHIMRDFWSALRLALRDWVRDPWVLYPMTIALGVTAGVILWIYL